MDARIIAAFAAMAGISVASAQPERGRPDARSYDISVGLVHFDAQDTGFDGGTVVSTESATGFSFSFDYFLGERWSVGATTSSYRPDYVADIAVAGPLGRPGEIVAGELDSTTLLGHAKRYFGDFGRVAPYASAGLGLASIDTNIPSGPPIGMCWWHPWWGYVCDQVQPTRTSTEPTMALGFGVRVNVGRRLFFDADVRRQWIDFDTANRPSFSQLRLAVGFR